MNLECPKCDADLGVEFSWDDIQCPGCKVMLGFTFEYLGWGNLISEPFVREEDEDEQSRG